MQKYVVLNPYFRFESAMGWAYQDSRRETYPTEDDRAADRRERLRFGGDTNDGPPLAWVVEWRGVYNNRFGCFLPESLKKWGHVFWDRKRLIRSQGIEHVLRER
jgi:hypothetical protein